MGWMNLNIYWQRGNDGKEAMLAIRFKEAVLTIRHGWQCWQRINEAIMVAKS